MFKNYPVEKLAKTNYPEILNVWETSVRATHDFLNEQDIQAYKVLLDNDYLSQMQLFGVIGELNELKGFIGIEGKKIQLLFISPPARGTGIGKALINFVFQHMDVREVDVNEQNIQAYDFYKYLGFETIERTSTDAIGKPFPVLSMELQ